MHVQSPTKEKVNNCCCCYVVAIDTEPSVKDTTHLWSQNALSQNGYGEREREGCVGVRVGEWRRLRWGGYVWGGVWWVGVAWGVVGCCRGRVGVVRG